MKARLIGKSPLAEQKKSALRAARPSLTLFFHSARFTRGSSTLEILIAFAILALSITAVILLVFGSQSISIDTQTNGEALALARATLEQARAQARSDFSSVTATTSTTTLGTVSYARSLQISDVTQCKKLATSSVSYAASPLRTITITLTTFLGDTAGALALGGDCNPDPPGKQWDNPQRYASDTMSPGKPTALDALNAMVYLGSDKTPFLYIADTHGAVLGQSGGLFVSYTNGFAASSSPNWLDAIRYVDGVGSTHYYLFAAMNQTARQLNVFEVTNPKAPVLVASSSLSGVSASGSFPQGWIVYYLNGRLYVTTRETNGPELHIFDVSTPSAPAELGSGTELGATVEGMVVREQTVSGATKRYAYLATDQNSGELKVYDVTNPLAVSEVVAARQDLPGSQDGQSVYAIGNKLYFGRLSTPGGPELYVYNISNPPAGLALLGSHDIGTSVLYILVESKFAFLATSKTNQEFQVWNIQNPASISLIKAYNFGNIVTQGIDYEYDFIYATGDSTPNFQIVYSPT